VKLVIFLKLHGYIRIFLKSTWIIIKELSVILYFIKVLLERKTTTPGEASPRRRDPLPSSKPGTRRIFRRSVKCEEDRSSSGRILRVGGDEPSRSGSAPDPAVYYSGYKQFSPALCEDEAQPSSVTSRCRRSISVGNKPKIRRIKTGGVDERVTAGGAVMIRGPRRGLGTFRCTAALSFWILMMMILVTTSSAAAAASTTSRRIRPAVAEQQRSSVEESSISNTSILRLMSKNNLYIQSFPNGTISATGHDTGFYCKFCKYLIYC